MSLLVPQNRVVLLQDLFLRNARVAEIGVWMGDYSWEILKHGPAELWLVDPWKNQEKSVWDDWMNLSQADMDAAYGKVVEKFKGDSRVKVVREYSLAAARKAEDGYFDLVYVDGNHSHEACLQDMDAWWPKVKPGGWLAGHDYDGCWKGVKEAVDAFLASAGLELGLLTREHEWKTWGIRRPA